MVGGHNAAPAELQPVYRSKASRLYDRKGKRRPMCVRGNQAGGWSENEVFRKEERERAAKGGSSTELKKEGRPTMTSGQEKKYL